MTVAAPIAAQASESIRAALAAELPPEAWSTVSDLVQRIDTALEDGDGRAVQRLSTELDSVRAYAGPPPPVMAPGRAAGARRRRWALLVLVAVLLLGAGGIALLGGDDGGGDTGVGPGFEETTTTEEAAEATTTIVDPNELATDLGPVVLGVDGELEIELQWSTTADLDLRVEEPDGTTITFRLPGPTDTGGTHGGDANENCVDSGSREVVSWPVGGAAAGEYLIFVDGFRVDECGGGAFELTVRTSGDALAIGGVIGEGESESFGFEAAGDEEPTTTTTEDEPPPPDDEEEAGTGDDPERSPLALGAVGVVSALVAGALVWLVGLRRLPARVAPLDSPIVAALARPRLPVPAELRELANHTIHRLEVGPS